MSKRFHLGPPPTGFRRWLGKIRWHARRLRRLAMWRLGLWPQVWISRHERIMIRGETVPLEPWRDVILRDPCPYCLEPSDSIDHIVATSRGGPNLWPNLAPACKRCNTEKGNRDLVWYLMDATRYAAKRRIPKVRPARETKANRRRVLEWKLAQPLKHQGLRDQLIAAGIIRPAGGV